MSDFAPTGITNLIRHRKSGRYYLQAKVAGKKVRKSLRTTSKKVARAKLPDELDRVRTEAEQVASFRGGRRGGGTEDRATWGGLVQVWLDRQMRRPELKTNTRIYYERISRYLAEGFAAESLVARLSVGDAEGWWLEVHRVGRPASVANAMLGGARQMMELAREAGVRRDDPFAGLRRVSPRESELVVPTAEEIDRLIEEVRRVGKAHSEESADLIEFLAFTGLRIGEAGAVEWRDVQGDFLRVRGGEEGTKSGKFRRVPIGRRVRALLDRRGGPGAQGGIFGMKSPREALANACRRLGMPHLRVHDLRHVFATQAAEAGVDIPTLARWLGHNDGGILAMKTYGHVRDEHMERMGKLIG